MTPHKEIRLSVQTVSKIKALAHPDSDFGLKHVVKWLSTRDGQNFIGLLYKTSGLCDELHTDDYQKVFHYLRKVTMRAI